MTIATGLAFFGAFVLALVVLAPVVYLHRLINR